MVSQACYTSSDGRRSYSHPYPMYFHPPERRYPLSSHDSRATTMAEQLDSDSTPQRKRIAVACGRCRKRKIRCSGDPGDGQPCSNCKNAGVDQCQFLRVSSREAPLRHDSGEFGYSVGDARVFASRTPVGGGMPYAQDGMPSLSSSDVLDSYRAGSSYPYWPASKACYTASSTYNSPYTGEFGFGIGVAPQPVMHPESVVPSQWSSGARAKPSSFSSMYMDTEGYSSYNGASMLHRPPHSVTSESPNFTFAAPLPLSSTPAPDRLLPNPAGHSSTLPYPTTVKPPTTPVSTSTASTLAEVALAATYAGGFDTPGLSFSSTASSSLSSDPSSSPRPNSDTYSASEGIFSEQERSPQNQGSAVDMNGYTSSPRRSSSLATGHAYVKGENPHEHHHPSLHQLSGSYLSGTSPSSPFAHCHGQTLASGSGSASHAAHSGDGQVAVASCH